MPGMREQNVGRFNVSVNQADLVERLTQSLRNRLGNLQGPAVGRVCRFLKVRRKGLAFNVFHYDVVIPVRLAAGEDADDPCRLQPGGEPGLAKEAVGRPRL